jgi:hypothetical protein
MLARSFASAMTRTRGSVVIPFGVLLLGLILAHYQFLAGPGRLLPGGPIDAAFVHYVLEHGYQWLNGGFSASFWNAPFFYPHPNSMANSEVLLGLLPFYAVWRAAGIGPGAAYQLWFVSLSVLNFFVLYLFLRKVVVVHRLPAAVGAYFFSFGSPRLNQIVGSHPQFWGQFYVVLAVWCLIRFLQSGTDEPRRRAVLWLSLAGAATALQLISGFYFGWFLCFSLLAALTVGLVQTKARQALWALLRRFWSAPFLAAAVFVALAGPGLLHYHAAAAEIIHNPRSGHPTMPTLGSWIYAGYTNFLYAWIGRFPQIAHVASLAERANGMGICTGILILAGAILSRRHPVFRPMLLVSAVVLILSFTIPGGWTLWQFVYRYVPGAPAVRIVSRWGVFLLFPFATALALCLDRIRTQRHWMATAVLGSVVLLEQINTVPHYDFQAFARTAANLAGGLKPECNCFFASHISRDFGDWSRLQVAAMWAQLVSGVPTVNGYSGYWPPGYPLFPTAMATSLDYPRTLGFAAWQNVDPHRPLRICWLRPETPSSAGLSLEIIAPVMDSPVQRFIRWSYIGILGRLPRPDETVSAESAAGARDRSWARLVLSLLQTPEAQPHVFAEKAYLALLDRDADADRWWSATNRSNIGIWKQDLVAEILRSEEYGKRSVPADPAGIVRQIDSDQKLDNRAFAGLMYLCLLGRPPDAGGALSAAHLLDTGMSKASIVNYFIGSPEYRALIGASP